MGSPLIVRIFAVFALLCINNHVNACKVEPCVKVAVYYESLCGDSIRFISQQLVPSYSDLKDYIDITFVPYGKATQEVDTFGKWSFKCQHGQEECLGNKAQACGLLAIEKVERPEDKQDLSVAFVGCAMASDNGPAIQQCTDAAGLSAETKKAFSECNSSQQGDEQLAAHGDRTHNLNPRLTFVPTIILDDKFSPKNQQMALSNFKALICSVLPAENKPSNC